MYRISIGVCKGGKLCTGGIHVREIMEIFHDRDNIYYLIYDQYYFRHTFGKGQCLAEQLKNILRPRRISNHITANNYFL